MKILTLVATLGLIVSSFPAHAQVDIGTYSIRTAPPVVHAPAPAPTVPTVPAGR